MLKFPSVIMMLMMYSIISSGKESIVPFITEINLLHLHIIPCFKCNTLHVDIVNPDVPARVTPAPWLIKYHTLVYKAMFIQPCRSYGAVVLCSGSEKCYCVVLR